MNNLVNIPKNGSVVKTPSTKNFPMLSTWLDDVLTKEIPAVFTSNFNTGITLPKVNIKETTDSFVLEMAVPGMNKSDFNIHVDNELLSITAEINDVQEHDSVVYTRREFGYSSFKRTFNLPETVNDSNIQATYENGILQVTLPKKEEAKQKPARTIEIS